MRIRKRGQSWQVDVRFDGKRYRPQFPTQGEAEAWLREAEDASQRGRPIPCSNGTGNGGIGARMSLRAACAACFRDEYSRSTSDWPKTVKLYMGAMQKFFGPDIRMNEIDAVEVSRFTEHLYERGDSQGTVNSKLSVLSKVLTWAMDRGVITTMPRVRRRKAYNERISFVTPEDEAKVVGLFKQWSKHDHVDVFRILIETGMRPGEVYKMRDEHINTNAPTISIPPENVKTGRARIIGMSEAVKTVLARRMGNGRPFPYSNRWFRSQWDRARHMLGKDGDPDFVPYILRHTFASRWVQRGGAIDKLSRWLGHSNIQMTMRYAKYATQDFVSEAALIGTTPATATPDLTVQELFSRASEADYKAIAEMVAAGMSPSDIATHFGIEVPH